MVEYPSAAERERLALLTEELGEALQIIGKIQRHGYYSHHPAGGPSNRELLEQELGDIRAAMAMMTTAGDLSDVEIRDAAYAKLEKVQFYLHHPDNVAYAVRAEKALPGLS